VLERHLPASSQRVITTSRITMIPKMQRLVATLAKSLAAKNHIGTQKETTKAKAPVIHAPRFYHT
jgi:SpoU rRNA methylase family enzyme